MVVDRSALGRRSRNKGKKFELVVRDHFSMHLDDPRFHVDGISTLVIRRSSQAERAWDADLIIEASNAPEWLLGLWIECEHANAPDPAVKMVQAIRDAAIATKRSGRQRTPVVVWRRTGERTLWISTYASWLNELLDDQLSAGALSETRGHGLLVTAKLEAVLTRLRSRL